MWLVKPKEGLSTPLVFRHLDYDQLGRVEPTHLLKQFVEGGLAEAEYVNDLELPAFKAMPSLQKMKTELQVGIPEINTLLFSVAITCRKQCGMKYEGITLRKTTLLVPSAALAPGRCLTSLCASLTRRAWGLITSSCLGVDRQYFVSEAQNVLGRGRMTLPRNGRQW